MEKINAFEGGVYANEVLPLPLFHSSQVKSSGIFNAIWELYPTPIPVVRGDLATLPTNDHSNPGLPQQVVILLTE